MTTMLPPICLGCSRFREQNADVFTCEAYPERIPETIITSQVDHRKPYEGDHGKQYLAVSPDDAAYAALLFRDASAA